MRGTTSLSTNYNYDVKIFQEGHLTLQLNQKKPDLKKGNNKGECLSTHRRTGKNTSVKIRQKIDEGNYLIMTCDCGLMPDVQGRIPGVVRQTVSVATDMDRIARARGRTFGVSTNNPAIEGDVSDVATV